MDRDMGRNPDALHYLQLLTWMWGDFATRCAEIGEAPKSGTGNRCLNSDFRLAYDQCDTFAP